MSDRKSGFYFVRPTPISEWEIGYWSDFPPCWELTGTDTVYIDSEITEIDERPIVREKKDI